MGEFQTLEEVCELIVDCPHSTPPWTDSGYLVIRNQNIRNGRLDLSQKSYTNQIGYEHRIRRAKPRAGDLIFTREAPMGEVCIVPEDLECCVGQRQVLLRPGARIDSKFLFYAMLSPFVQHQVGWNEGTGSTVSNVRIPVLKAIQVPRYGNDEEVAIANVLSALDDKIELNRRTNETLEAMAQAVFKDWFVDFGPVRRKRAGETDPQAILGGLIDTPAQAKLLAALFPDTLGNNDLPEGWNVGTLDRLSNLNPESWKASNRPAFVDYIDLANTKWGTIGSIPHLSWENAPSRARRITRPGDTIVATTRPGNGSYAYISEEGLTASTGFAVLRPKHQFYCSATYIAATLPQNIERLAMLADAHGGAYPAVKPDVVLATPFVDCGDALLKAFETIAKPMREKAEFSKIQNQTLAETRDYLLPKLMSGQIRAGEAEGRVGL